MFEGTHVKFLELKHTQNAFSDRFEIWIMLTFAILENNALSTKLFTNLVKWWNIGIIKEWSILSLMANLVWEILYRKILAYLTML